MDIAAFWATAQRLISVEGAHPRERTFEKGRKPSPLD